MDDFDHSVEISERDWDCFFQECEECSLLPPTLAGMDDSGMSDLDDSGSAHSNEALVEPDPGAAFLDDGRPPDGPPDREGSPLPNDLSRYAVGVWENVLSGSEEDVHLESVNRFFERLRSLTDTGLLVEPGTAVGKTVEAEQREEACSDGTPANLAALPANILEFDSQRDVSETAAGRETAGPEDSDCTKDTGADFKMAPEHTHDASHDEADQPFLDTELVVREEEWSVTTAHKRQNTRDEKDLSPDPSVCPDLPSAPGELPQSPGELPQSPGELPQSPGELPQSSHTCLPSAPGELPLSPGELPQSSHTCLPSAPGELPLSPGELPQSSHTCLPSAPGELPLSPGELPQSSHTCLPSAPGELPLSPGELPQSSHTCLPSAPGELPLSPGELPQSSQTCLPSAPGELPLSPGELPQSSQTCLPSAPGELPQSSQTRLAESMGDLRPEGDLADQTVLNRSLPLQEKESPVNLDVIPCDNEAEESTCVGLSNTQSCQLGVSGLASQELSPAGNNKKKKRRRKRASMEPVEAGSRYERQVSGNRSDSDEETPASSAAEISPRAKLSGDCCDGFMIEHIRPPQSLADDKDLSTPIYSGANVGTHLQPCRGSTLRASMEFKECARHSCATCVGGEPGSTGNLATSQTEHEPQVNNTRRKTNELQEKDMDRGLMNMEDFTGFISPKQDSLCVVTGTMIGLDTQGQTVGGEMLHEFTRPSLDFREIQKEARTDLTLLSEKLSHRRSFHSDTGNSRTHDREDLSQTVCPENETDTMSALPHVDRESSFKSPISEKEKSSLSAFKGNQNRVDVSNITPLTVLPVSKHSNASPTSSSESPDTLSTYCGTPPISDTSEITDKNKSQDVCEKVPELRADSPGEGHVTGSTPDPNMTVYAMSSFWKDMEQMTINDILRFRGIDAVQPPVTPPYGGTAVPVDGVDSGYFGQRGDSNPQLSGEVFNIASFDEDSNPIGDPDAGDVSSDSCGVLWESKSDSVGPGDEACSDHVCSDHVCSDHVTLLKDLPQQLIPGSPQKYYVKKMYKNRSMQNLPDLESKPLGQSLKSPVLPTVIAEEGESDTELFSEEHALRQDCGLDSLPPSSFPEHVTPQSYRVSVTDIFRYFFTGSTSEPSQSDTDAMQTTAASYAGGNSVAETYDHFFSDFEMDSFFYPLLEEGHDKNQTVPIFSCSRSANRNLQFPDAYDHFFPSSDDSSMESDEEDRESRAPIRVVSRFTLKEGEIQGASSGPDIYENFFSDWDQGVFWKNGLSLRNVRFPGSTYQRPTSDYLALVPVNQNRKLVQRTIQPIKVLGNQDRPFLDPLLYNFSDRLVRQLAEQRHKDLQIAVANPRLDAPLLNASQADMCLVCIAFASWVLKSANPQGGDVWKAVLLANVSALSAIRYMRRHAREEEEESNQGGGGA